MCGTATGTPSHSAPVLAFRSLLIRRVGDGGDFDISQTMTRRRRTLRVSAFLHAKQVEGCLSTPKHRPFGTIWTFLGQRMVRRAAPKGAGRSQSTNRGGVIPRRSGPGSISAVFHPSWSRHYRSLYVRTVLSRLSAELNVSEPRQLSLPGSSSWLGGHNE